MRVGPKGKSPEQRKLSGFSRPCREVAVLFPDHESRPDPDEMPPPSDMTSDARKLWISKIERYRHRGQKIDGFQDALRQYCELEAALNKQWQYTMPPMAMVNAYRLYAAEFYDTPASQKTSARKQNASDNPFAQNGRRT